MSWRNTFIIFRIRYKVCLPMEVAWVNFPGGKDEPFRFAWEGRMLFNVASMEEKNSFAMKCIDKFESMEGTIARYFSFQIIILTSRTHDKSSNFPFEIVMWQYWITLDTIIGV